MLSGIHHTGQAQCSVDFGSQSPQTQITTLELQGMTYHAPYHTPRIFFGKDNQGNEVPPVCQALLRELRKFREAAFPNDPFHSRVLFTTSKTIEDVRKIDDGFLSTFGLTSDEKDKYGQPYTHIQLALDPGKLPRAGMKGEELKKANEYLATFLWYAFHELLIHALPRATRLYQGKTLFLEETEHRKFYYPGGEDLRKNQVFNLFVRYLNATNERFEKLCPEELKPGLIKAYKEDVANQIKFAFDDDPSKRAKYQVLNVETKEEAAAELFLKTLQSKDANDPIWSDPYIHPSFNLPLEGDRRSVSTIEHQLRQKNMYPASESSGRSLVDPSSLQFDKSDLEYNEDAAEVLEAKQKDPTYSSGSPSGYES